MPCRPRRKLSFGLPHRALPGTLDRFTEVTERVSGVGDETNRRHLNRFAVHVRAFLTCPALCGAPYLRHTVAAGAMQSVCCGVPRRPGAAATLGLVGAP